jgi:hypothetical protein
MKYSCKINDIFFFFKFSKFERVAETNIANSDDKLTESKTVTVDLSAPVLLLSIVLNLIVGRHLMMSDMQRAADRRNSREGVAGKGQDKMGKRMKEEKLLEQDLLVQLTDLQGEVY